MNTELSNRWRNDAAFMKAIDFLLVESVASDPNQLKAWYSTLPKVSHPLGEESADFRCMHLEGLTLDRLWLCYVLDGTVARSCRFVGTRLQGASLRNCDFSESRFERAQMSPVCADGASFVGCIFDQSFLMAEPRPLDGVELGSFRNCDFSRVQARRTDWDAADLRGSRLSQALPRLVSITDEDDTDWIESSVPATIAATSASPLSRWKTNRMTAIPNTPASLITVAPPAARQRFWRKK